MSWRVEDSGLALESFQLALAGAARPRLWIRRDRLCRLRPALREMAPGDSNLFLEPLELLIKQFQAALDGPRLLPIPIAVQRCQSGHAPGKTAQVSDEGRGEPGEGAAPRPGFRKDRLKATQRGPPEVANPQQIAQDQRVESAMAARRPRNQSIWRAKAKTRWRRGGLPDRSGLISRSSRGLMPEVPDAGKDHGHAETVGGVNDVLILY